MAKGLTLIRGLREDDVIYPTPANFNTIKRPDPILIRVTALKRKKGKEDTRELEAWLIENGSRKEFIINDSRHDLEHFHRFHLTPGAVVEFNGQKFECFAVPVLVSAKIHQVLQTIPIAS